MKVKAAIQQIVNRTAGFDSGAARREIERRERSKIRSDKQIEKCLLLVVSIPTSLRLLVYEAAHIRRQPHRWTVHMLCVLTNSPCATSTCALNRACQSRRARSSRSTSSRCCWQAALHRQGTQTSASMQGR
jgi:hypothetical protein